MLFKRKLKKDSVHITFGSSAGDNEYYMEFRTASVEGKPFLCLFTTSEGIIVYNYEAEDAISLGDFLNQIDITNDAAIFNTEYGLYYMDKDDFNEMLSASEQRLLKAKSAFLDVLKQHPDWD